jgi:long-chain acyl-CoA synthetase
MANLRDLASYETPKRLSLLAEDFSVDAGEITPTLKVKRRVVEQKYAAEIDALYTDANEG